MIWRRSREMKLQSAESCGSLRGAGGARHPPCLALISNHQTPRVNTSKDLGCYPCGGKISISDIRYLMELQKYMFARSMRRISVGMLFVVKQDGHRLP